MEASGELRRTRAAEGKRVGTHRAGCQYWRGEAVLKVEPLAGPPEPPEPCRLQGFRQFHFELKDLGFRV